MYLLYCIMKTPPSPLKPAVAGLGGSPVFLTSCNGLSAALSELPPSPGLPESKELLDYNRVIEDFHRCHGVIPVRYGSCFNDPSNVQNLLRLRKRQYLSLLEELAGSVEMGVRILFQADHGHSGESSSFVPAIQGDDKEAPAGLVIGKGHDFLAARRTYYAQVDQVSRCYNREAAYYGKVFSECALRHTFETDEGKSLLSLYFLVPVRQVESFRETFHSIEKRVEERIMMSGPWPPYNFACKGSKFQGSQFRSSKGSKFQGSPEQQRFKVPGFTVQEQQRFKVPGFTVQG